MARLDGKIALVTGAAQGMGAAHAQRLAAEGARVVLADVDQAKGEALAEEIGDRARFVRLDVSDASQWTDAIRLTEAVFGSLNVLVNNAGVLGPVRKTADLSEAEFSQVCAVNQLGVFLGVKAALPSMLRAGPGSIINISSIAGIRAVEGTSNLAYAASKFAVRGMTKCIAMEYAEHGIRANSIHPGYVRTPMMTDVLDEETITLWSGTVPLKRVAQPSEVSSLVVFLASDESAFITGAEHIIDGGMTAK